MIQKQAISRKCRAIVTHQAKSFHILTYQPSIVYMPFHLSFCYIRSFISASTTAQLSIGLFTGLCVSETLIWVQTSRGTIQVNSVFA
ncbi:hypothetical protein BJV82DRAFT_628412 [Fennellomyces sp. T-0311]|nr:hypothetical protein BJV82DRAFT_628412 [Fennellomyces sp. T-0311]